MAADPALHPRPVRRTTGPGRAAAGRARAAAARLDAATPAHRDRGVDALRAFAILGVVLGHWLVTALVTGGAAAAGPAGASWQDLSPLGFLPALAPMSWAFQTLAVFFFVGGYAGARSLRGPGGARRPAGPWIRGRMSRLLRPVMVLPLFWGPFALLMAAAGADPVTLVRLAVNPLWFLLVYAGLTALTPLLDRLPAYAAVAPAVVVALADLGRFGLGGPAWLGWVTVPAGWLVPYLLGMAWAGGALTSRRAAWSLFAGGAAAVAALIAAGYPASMVGVPGAAVSNLNPPTAAAVAFGVAQVGLALLVRDRLARWMRRPVAWAGVALANLSAMTVFCWHQTAFMLVTLAGLAFGTLPGLHDAPDHWTWVLWRLAWLPAFAAALLACRAAFGRFERPR